MFFIECIRKHIKSGIKIEDAVDAAVDECIAENVLAEFLQKHRAEVRSMCITEYNEKVFVNGIKEEGREEGRKEGILSILVSLVLDQILSIDEAAEKAGMAVEEFRKQTSL